LSKRSNYIRTNLKHRTKAAQRQIKRFSLLQALSYVAESINSDAAER